MNKSLKKAVPFITAFAIVIALVIFSYYGSIFAFRVIFQDTPEKRQLWRDNLRAVIADIKPGLSREQVISIAKEHGFSENQIGERDTEIFLYTPGEFGASNWVIRIGFSGDKLIHVKVRTDDDIDFEHPTDAPEDIVYSHKEIDD
jgi:hypothetical protein